MRIGVHGYGMTLVNYLFVQLSQVFISVHGAAHKKSRPDIVLLQDIKDLFRVHGGSVIKGQIGLFLAVVRKRNRDLPRIVFPRDYVIV